VLRAKGARILLTASLSPCNSAFSPRLRVSRAHSWENQSEMCRDFSQAVAARQSQQTSPGISPKNGHAEARRTRGKWRARKRRWTTSRARSVDASIQAAHGLGPGLLESVYEVVLARVLERRGLRVARQEAVSFDYDGLHFRDCLRIDLLVDSRVVVEIKSVEKILPVHPRQLLTYLRLMHLRSDC